jgi:hypothetical protein
MYCAGFEGLTALTRMPATNDLPAGTVNALVPVPMASELVLVAVKPVALTAAIDALSDADCAAFKAVSASSAALVALLNASTAFA